MAEINLKNTSTLEKKKAFECEVCKKRFSQKKNLSTHILSIHEGKKGFKCNFCDKSFSQKSCMTRHRASVHEEKKTVQL